MERGRFSKEYAQFLCDRFYHRYRKTCYIKLSCVVHGCDNFIPIRANIPEPEQNKLMNTFKCKSCASEDYTHWSDEDEVRSSIMGDTE
jgi:hypothetical protein